MNEKQLVIICHPDNVTLSEIERVFVLIPDYEIEKASIAGEALQKIGANAVRSPIVLYGFNTPDMNVIQFSQALRNIGAFPFIVILEKDDTNDISLCTQAGARDILIRPLQGYIIEEKLKTLKNSLYSMNQGGVKPMSLPDAFENAAQQNIKYPDPNFPPNATFLTQTQSQPVQPQSQPMGQPMQQFGIAPPAPSGYSSYTPPVTPLPYGQPIQPGFPPQGNGFPPQGQGYSPQGQGFPPQGQGYSPQGQGFPPQGQGFPPQGQGFPPQGQGFPPQGQGFPPQGNGVFDTSQIDTLNQNRYPSQPSQQPPSQPGFGGYGAPSQPFAAPPMGGGMPFSSKSGFGQNPMMGMSNTQSQAFFKQKVVVVHSSKGGVGKTTFSTNMSALFAATNAPGDAQKRKLQVCLIDMNADYGNVNHAFRIKHPVTMFDWAEDIKERLSGGDFRKVAYSREEVDKYLFRPYKPEESGLAILLAPMGPTQAIEITEQVAQVIINTLRKYGFDLIMIDTGNNVRAFTLVSLEQADEVVLMCPPDIFAVNTVFQFLNSMNAIGTDKNKFKLVVSMIDKYLEFSPMQISTELGIPLLGTGKIVYDAQLRAHNNKDHKGHLYVEKNHQFAEQLKGIGNAIIPVFYNGKKQLGGSKAPGKKFSFPFGKNKR